MVPWPAFLTPLSRRTVGGQLLVLLVAIDRAAFFVDRAFAEVE